jgi:peptide/nickel transport system permease protein
MIAGYAGGRVDTCLMRVVDATLAFPIILFAILLVVILGGSLVTVVIAVALVLWARYARVIRGEVLSLRERDFVAQARIAGCSSGRIILVHIFPNVLNTLVVLLSLQVGWVIIVEASLSFLGAGVPPPTPTWGSMIAEGRDYIASAWWVSFFPGLAILVTVLAFNLCGDWLRDALDPTMRQM